MNNLEIMFRKLGRQLGDGTERLKAPDIGFDDIERRLGGRAAVALRNTIDAVERHERAMARILASVECRPAGRSLAAMKRAGL